ncbi:protein MEMO1 [Histomonas meleagridis]|uniref:protein MEMO1 n=1 Tax=Histomonas meleagridis TaxID=135588 RepID=UPI003559D00D|nr:protein MEMO1 [Histomonas meleagridis]KAH0805463.1 protein MEMO1 [Histomonas meleagridis]
MTHSGEWYPVGEELEKMLKASFYYAPTTPQDKEGVVGIISPHSCYSVCLKIAAKSYSLIDPTKYDKIILLGPCHHIALPNCLVSTASDVITPFGPIQVDTELCNQLIADPMFSPMEKKIDEAEHSHEMQYPLIKYVFGDRPIKVVPILVGSLNESREEKVNSILQPIIKSDRTLFIISSDFIHWGEIFKFTLYANTRISITYQLQLFDMEAMNLISNFDYSMFKTFIEKINGSICGCYAIYLILHMFCEGYTAKMIERGELAQLVSSNDFSISYMAIVFKYKEIVESNKESMM